MSKPEGSLVTMGREQGDLELLRRVAGKDRRAFERLYMDYHQRVFRFLFRLTGRADVVEEVFNDVMFVVWQKADQFHGRSRVSTWILGIAYRKGLKALERLRRMPEQQSGEYDQLRDPANPEAEISRGQIQAVLREALAVLPPEQRMVIGLADDVGYSCREIAGIAECPVNTVKTRMFHARKRLKEYLPWDSFRQTYLSAREVSS